TLKKIENLKNKRLVLFKETRIFNLEKQAQEILEDINHFNMKANKIEYERKKALL
ncbi:MAG: hypothetical protein ACJATX_000312, partial [Candidatus Paceibacteria bacterium]